MRSTNCWVERRNGSGLWTHLKGTSLFDAAGRCEAGVALMTDVTERRRVEAELRTTEEQLRRQHRSRLQQPAVGRRRACRHGGSSSVPGISRRKVDLNQLVSNMQDMLRDPPGDDIEFVTLLAPSELDLDTSAGTEASLPAGAYVVLSFRDTGMGMDASTRARIFEPFFTTKGEKGSGLGLSIVLGIVRENGGGILMESESGHAASFRVLLPAQS